MNIKKIYKITALQQLLLLSPVLITNFILLSIYLYFFGWKIPTQLFFYIFLFRFVIDILPVIILHIQYLYANLGDILILDVEKKMLQYNSSGKMVEHSFKEIESLDYYVSYGRGTGWYSFEAYRYCRIAFDDQSEIVITCLMINKIEKELEAVLGTTANKHLKVMALLSKRRFT